MSFKENILNQIQTTLQHQPDLIAVYLFGSVAEGRNYHQSDIDVAVLFTDSLEPDQIFQETLNIGTALESVLPYPIDVVALNLAGPFLCFQVIQKGEVIIQRDEVARCLFHVRTMNLYFDAKPYFDYQQHMTIRRIREKGLRHGYQGDGNMLFPSSAEMEVAPEQLGGTSESPVESAEKFIYLPLISR